MEELKKLYDTLVREGYYTNSYDEFVQKYNGSDAYKDQVFGVVSRDGLYTKTKEEFLLKYKSPELKTESFVEDEVAVKKKTLRTQIRKLVYWSDSRLSTIFKKMMLIYESNLQYKR